MSSCTQQPRQVTTTNYVFGSLAAAVQLLTRLSSLQASRSRRSSDRMCRKSGISSCINQHRRGWALAWNANIERLPGLLTMTAEDANSKSKLRKPGTWRPSRSMVPLEQSTSPVSELGTCCYPVVAYTSRSWSAVNPSSGCRRAPMSA